MSSTTICINTPQPCGRGGGGGGPHGEEWEGLSPSACLTCSPATFSEGLRPCALHTHFHPPVPSLNHS